jgi:uncharacterized protein (UPF0212 family)
MTGGAFAGLSTATITLNTSLTALISNLNILGITLGSIAAVAAPLTVFLSAIAAAWASLETDKLKFVNESFDKELSGANKAFTEAMNLKTKLAAERKKALQGDGVIDETEKASMEALKVQLGEKKTLIEKSIANQKELLKNANEDQKKAINSSISELQKLLPKIDPIEIEVKMQGLESIGDAYKFIREESDRSLKQLRENQFQSTDEAERVSKTAIANTKQEIELGILSIEEARKRYAEITQFGYLSAASRIAAEKELTALTKLEGDRRKDEFEKTSQIVQQKINDGIASQISGEKMLTEVKIKSAQDQLEITKQLIAEQDAIAASHTEKMNEDKRKLLAEAEKIKANISKFENESEANENPK